MWVSRLMLNPRNSRVQELLADAYARHVFVMHAWKSEEPRVLFRVEDYRNEEMSQTQGLTLLVQSQTQPDWRWLQKSDWRGVLVSGAEVATKEVALPLVFQEWQYLYFKLRANPTVARDGKHFGIVRHEEQLKWLRRQGEKAGFTVVEAVARNEGLVQGYNPDSQHVLKFTAVTFEGAIQVTNPEKINQALASGIGRGKGFGFGMLSVRRYS